jgi:hypothetical protein
MWITPEVAGYGGSSCIIKNGEDQTWFSPFNNI